MTLRPRTWRLAVRALEDEPNYTRTKQCCRDNLRHLHIYQGSSLLPLLCLSQSLHHHPSATQGKLHTIHLTDPRSASHFRSTFFRHRHPSFLPYRTHLSKSAQYSLIHRTRQLSFYSSSSTNLFILNYFYSYHSNHTTQAHHSTSLSTPLHISPPHAVLAPLLIHIDSFMQTFATTVTELHLSIWWTFFS